MSNTESIKLGSLIDFLKSEMNCKKKDIRFIDKRRSRIMESSNPIINIVQPVLLQ